MPPSSPSMEEFGSDIQKKKKNFKRSKDIYLSKNNKNKLKNAGFKGNFKYQEAVSFTGYSL